MGQRIRTATPADAGAIAQLHLASYQAAYQGLLPAEFLSSLSAEDRRRRWLIMTARWRGSGAVSHEAVVALGCRPVSTRN